MDKLEQRKQEIEKEFEEVNQKRKGLLEQYKDLQRQLNEVDTLQKKLQGAYAEVNALLVPEEPKKKK